MKQKDKTKKKAATARKKKCKQKGKPQGPTGLIDRKRKEEEEKKKNGQDGCKEGIDRQRKEPYKGTCYTGLNRTDRKQTKRAATHNRKGRTNIDKTGS